MRKGIKRKAVKTIAKKGKFIRLVTNDGWEYVERVNCSGVVIILPMTDDKKVIFIEQYRIPVKRKTIEFPAGLVNDKKLKRKETLIEAAKRELLEETGYKAKRIVKLVEGPASSGTSSDMLTMVRAIDIKKVADGGGDDSESIIVHEVPLKSAEKWLLGMKKKGRLVGTRIYAGLYFLNKYNK